jgi:hypothetical protein
MITDQMRADWDRRATEAENLGIFEADWPNCFGAASHPD